MNKVQWLAILSLAGLLTTEPSARAQKFSTRSQTRPYIGFVYPAGGQQGTTFQVKLGGQNLGEIIGVTVTGSGVSARLLDYQRNLNPQDMRLLTEQLAQLRRSKTKGTSRGKSFGTSRTASGVASSGAKDEATQKLIERIQQRTRDYVQRPASASIASIAFVEVTIAPDAAPGERELRLVTLRGGASNPLVFHVGQLPEFSRKPMRTAALQILGKEYLAQRKRPENEAEDRITIPCTLNGQIASGEINQYRFGARKGQRLVITTLARQLIPYLADAVPGWFQPMLSLYDAAGKEVAFNDDYRFKPDPMTVYEIPKDGEYVLAITDAIYRGREDFVYRITIGELPFVSGIFPLGGRVGEPVSIKMKGWNLGTAELTPPAAGAEAGIHLLAASKGGFVANRVPFVLDTLPAGFDKEANNTPARAQKVTLPIIINGRIDVEDDWDVFQFTGQAGETVVAEVNARRLDSPMDSVIKITDANGKLLAFSDDCEDLGAGINTHHADSHIMSKLPADGTYFVHIGDTGRKGGEEYGYRLRISTPQPDFALLIVPSSINVREESTTALTIYAMRKDGFDGPIKITLKDPPAGFTADPVFLKGSQNITRFSFRAGRATKAPISLSVIGSAKIGDKAITHAAVAAEDRMQAFLWRHLVPAQDLKVFAYDPSVQLPPKRIPRERPPVVAEAKVMTFSAKPADNKSKFTKQQVAGRLRQLKALFEEGLLTDDFYEIKVAECETPN